MKRIMKFSMGAALLLALMMSCSSQTEEKEKSSSKEIATTETVIDQKQTDEQLSDDEQLNDDEQPGDIVEESNVSEKNVEVVEEVVEEIVEEKKPKVTFIELGSVRCRPCQMMVPIMESVEEKFGDQIEVVFYDVWTEEGKPYGEKYNVRGIPTQVFLDENGVEYYRHVGFFPEDKLIEVLKMKGVQ